LNRNLGKHLSSAKHYGIDVHVIELKQSFTLRLFSFHVNSYIGSSKRVAC